MSFPPDTNAGVEAGRQEIRLLFSRRAFVGAGAVATLTALGLDGCASGNDSGGNGGGQTDHTSQQQVTGSVQLPSGSTLDPATLSVDVGGAVSTVSAGGGFAAWVADTGPSLALLQDATGNIVLMGLIDPAQSGSYATTSRSTATALIHFAMGGYALGATDMSRVRVLVDADPATASLEQAVAAAVAASPAALQSSDAVANALLAAVQTMMSSSLIRPSPALRDDPTLLLINPPDPQGGIRVDQPSNAAALVISNSWRRPARVYVYAVTTLAGNQTTQLVPAKRVAGVIELSSTATLNVVNSIRDLLALARNPGSAPQSQWQPVTLDPIPLALEAGADRTTFQVIVITASFKSLALDMYEPAAYRDTHFTNEVAQWRTDEQALLLRSFFGDIVFPLVCLLGGLGAIRATEAGMAGIVDAIAAERSAAFTTIINQLEYGSLGSVSDAMAYCVRTALTSDVSTLFYRNDVQNILGRAVETATAQVTPTALQTRLTKAGKVFLGAMRTLLAVQGVMEALDLGAVLKDLASSDVADVWSALLVKQGLNLLPLAPAVTPGERVSFTVSTPSNTTDQIQYVWTQTSLFAVLSSVGDDQTGSTITTMQRNVDLVTTGSDTGTITVDVKGYDQSTVDATGNHPLIGEARTTVRLLQRAQITPTNPAIDIGQQAVFVVQVDGTLPAGTTYRWTLTGTAGSIGASNVVTTSVPQITYTGHQSGTDVIHVDVLDNGGQLIAKADDGAAVALQPVINFTVSGPWARGPGNGSYTYTLQTAGRDPTGPPRGYDGYEVVYGNAGFQNGAVFILFSVPTGSSLFTGQSFTWVDTDPPINEWGGAFATNQANPDDPSSGIATGVYGTLKFSAVSKTSDGGTLIQYTFSLDNADGGSINGTGVAKVT